LAILELYVRLIHEMTVCMSEGKNALLVFLTQSTVSGNVNDWNISDKGDVYYSIG